MKRVLILTAGYGEGHNAAAKALAAAVKESGAEPQVRDFFRETYGHRQRTFERLYLECINRAPWLWLFIYEALHRLPILRLTAFTLAPLQNRLAAVLREWKPDAVVSVYPAYGYLIERIYPKGAPFGNYVIVTDSITVNSAWYRCKADAWFVPNEPTAVVMREAGVPAEKIEPLGFPVPLVFADAAQQPVPRVLPGNGNALRVLYMVNHAPEQALGIARAIRALPDVELVVAYGRHDSLGRQLAGEFPDMELHGWTDQMPKLLMRSHVLIGKAGGATVQEAIASRTPMIVTKAVPGQEEGNARLLVEAGAGAVCPDAGTIARQIAELAADNAKLWHQWHAALGVISRPAAARDLTARILR